MATQIQKLALDVYNRVPVMYNEKSGEDALKEAFLKSVGGEWNYYNFQKNKYDFFQLLTETLTLPLGQTMEGMFDGITKTETIPLGDKKVINVERQDLFKVATVSAGNSDIRRQRVWNRQVTVETGDTQIVIYEDFDKFLAGRINWTNLVDRVRRSVANDTATKVYNALIGSYSASNSNYNKTGTFSESILDTMIARVEGKTGLKCAIYGTKEALGQISTGSTNIITKVGASDKLKEDYATLGYFRDYKGTPMIEIPSILVPGTDDFAFGTNLFILPIGEEIINVVFEGQPIVDDAQDSTRRTDRQIEFLFNQKVGIAVLVASYFGIYKLQ